ncbi:hypothetical protein DFH07DRAFT_522637 [Mycena maculata]|uniref:RING-type domain-containing protein n=1 Tax=Mycena maculata TaxID=230809 RepID=A0AAD7J013_9AGAR|nr:hypothetical protein DFH07DRAFT_522637 [Mycena maculata]
MSPRKSPGLSLNLRQLEASVHALHADDDEYMQYALNLGAETPYGSVAPTPPRTPRLRLDVGAVRSRRSGLKRAVEAQVEGDCGICFEYAVAPVQTSCCAHVFCREHIDAWLTGPGSDGLCPACCAPSPLSPLAALPTLPTISPSSPSPLSSSSPSDASPDPFSPSSDSEDATDYSYPALQHAKALQARRHAPHPLSSVLGLRGALASLLRVGGCVVVVAVLAGSGRWAASGVAAA